MVGEWTRLIRPRSTSNRPHRSGVVVVPDPALRAPSLPNMVYTTAVRQLRRDGNTEPRDRRTGRLFPHPSPLACRHSRRPDNCRKLCRQESYSQTSSARRRKLQCTFQTWGRNVLAGISDDWRFGLLVEAQAIVALAKSAELNVNVWSTPRVP